MARRVNNVRHQFRLTLVDGEKPAWLGYGANGRGVIY